MKTITKCGPYVARNGEICRVVCVDNAGPHPVVVAWPNGSVTTHHADGSFSNYRDHARDLIREHREPQRITFEGRVGWDDCVVGEGEAGERNAVYLSHPSAPNLTGIRYRVTVEEIVVEGGES